jgi:hypothetical protein
MSTTPAERSSAARMTRHRERRRQGTRCVTVNVSQNERDETNRTGFRWHDAELYRVRGEILPNRDRTNTFQ